MASKPVQVLACRVGRRPVVETLQPDVNGCGHLASMQALVGGYVEHITLDDGTDLWANEEALLLGLPLNRVIPAVPRPAPTLFGEPVEIIYADPGLAQPGEPGEWRIHGDFFLTLSDDATGELLDVSDEVVKKYTATFETEDIIAAKRMNDLMVCLADTEL